MVDLPSLQEVIQDDYFALGSQGGHPCCGDDDAKLLNLGHHDVGFASNTETCERDFRPNGRTRKLPLIAIRMD